MISLRTRDEVTLAASRRLFALAPDARSLAEATEAAIARTIYPAGFYRTKARNLRAVARRIIVDHEGTVPNTVEALVAFPGVGRKTANLVLGLGYAIPAICVDTHVHRIANRCGWVETASPEATEAALTRILPREHWIEINELLVSYGQRVCTPQSPRCSGCKFAGGCPRIGVVRSR